MLSYVIMQLFVTPIYCWFFLWQLGYHGVFLVILINLIISANASLWDLYQNWAFDTEFTLTPAVWIEFGNCDIIPYAISSTFIANLILVIMTTGAFIVLIFVYVEMWDDKEGANFAILLVLFLGFMGVLAASANLFVFYLGWEGIGLTSLFLISFWSERARAIKATLKVYTINKFGDYMILVGISLLFIHVGATNFDALNFLAPLIDNYNILVGNGQVSIVELCATLFVVGGGVKSAQFGFHIWLLEAMEAPLGASALMHSSTLVIAGVVLVYKMAGLVEQSLIATNILILWGSWTTFFAAFVACFQFELKIIMAYSTISSMGFLYCLLGLHAYATMLNYLVIHAFIKIFFFLIMGAIMLHCNGCQDIRWMGGLMHYIPTLYVFYILGSISLAGLPYWSGYYCKSAAWFITATHNSYIAAAQIILLLTTLCTYIYLLRAGYLIFFGPKNGHRSIYRMRYQSPLVTAAFWILSIAAAYSGALWTHMCNTTLEATQTTLLATYETCAQLISISPRFAILLLIGTYMLIFYGLYRANLMIWPAGPCVASRFFILFEIFYLGFIIYILV